MSKSIIYIRAPNKNKRAIERKFILRFEEIMLLNFTDFMPLELTDGLDKIIPTKTAINNTIKMVIETL